MNNFYGYGNYKGDFWFIGMEEHCRDSFEEVQNRLNVWQKRGKHELEDVAGYHTELGIPEPFRDKKPTLQPTWSKLIQVLLTAQTGMPPDQEEVRAYQQRLWARHKGNECLLELFPLPSPSTKHWLYSDHSHLSSLVSRERYRDDWGSSRIVELKNYIQVYCPKVVIFYSFNYLKYWHEIAGSNLMLAETGELYACQKDETLFVVVKHPNTRGITNNYFHNVGQFIKSELSKH